MAGRDHLIVALDVPERARVISLAESVREHVAMVKVGLEAYIAHGPDLVRALRDVGVDVFLDLKIHDIPRTAHAAVTQAAALDVRLLTIHAAGGAAMVEAAKEAAQGRTQIIAVTVLTSFDEAALREVGFTAGVGDTALGLGKLAVDNGADGLVCSPHELAALKPLGGVRVVPGVRPAGSAKGDQKRTATPAEAFQNGASWLVVGRPIVQADDPRAAAAAIAGELEAVGA